MSKLLESNLGLVFIIGAKMKGSVHLTLTYCQFGWEGYHKQLFAGPGEPAGPLMFEVHKKWIR